MAPRGAILRGWRAAALALAALLALAASAAADDPGPCDQGWIVQSGLRLRLLYDPTRNASFPSPCNDVTAAYPNFQIITSGGNTPPTLEDIPYSNPKRKAFKYSTVDGSGGHFALSPTTLGDFGQSDFSIVVRFRTDFDTASDDSRGWKVLAPNLWNWQIYSDKARRRHGFSATSLGSVDYPYSDAPGSYPDGGYHTLVVTKGETGRGVGVAVFTDLEEWRFQPAMFINPNAINSNTRRMLIAPYLNGAVDEIRIYNRRISNAEAFHLAQNWRPCQTAQGYWVLVTYIFARFDEETEEIFLYEEFCFSLDGACISAQTVDDLWTAANSAVGNGTDNRLECTPQQYADPDSWCYQCSDVVGKVLPKPTTTTQEPTTTTTRTTSTSITTFTQTPSTTSLSQTTTITRSSTTSKSRTTFTTRAGSQFSCNNYVELCQRCQTDGVYVVNSTASALRQMSDDDYALFSDIVAGKAQTFFGLSSNFPELAVAVGNGGLCINFNSSQSIAAPAIFSRSDISFASSFCESCIGGLPALNLTKFLIHSDTSGKAIYADIAATIGDIPIADGVKLTSLSFGIVLDAEVYTVTGKARLSVPALNNTGPLVTLSFTNASISVDINLDGLNWGLMKLVRTMGVTVSVPDADVQGWLENAGVLKSIAGTICAPGAGSPCDHSVTIIATIAKGQLISLDGGFFKLEEVLFEAGYARTNGTSSFRFAVTGNWRVDGKVVSARGEVEVPLSGRAVVWDSEMQEAGEGGLRSPFESKRRRRMALREERDPVPVNALERYGDADRGARHALYPRAPKFIVTIESKSLPLGAILAELATSVIPVDLSFVTEAIKGFSINNFLMRAMYQGGSYQFRARGSPSPVPVATLELQAGTLDSKRIAAAALVIEVGSFSSVGQLLTAMGSAEMNLNAVPVAPSNAGTAVFATVAMTSVDLGSNPDWKWSIPSIAAETSIPAGLVVAADFGFPSDCKGESICQTFRGFMGSARLRLAIRVKSDEFACAASLVNLKINKDLTLSKVGFELVLGKKTRLAVVGELVVKVSATQSLTFGAEVAAIFTPPKVELKGYMAGMWSNAFGIPRFAVGNIVIALGVTATSPVLGLPMPAFTLGGEIAIGPQPCYYGDTPPPKTFKCTDWTDAELKFILDPKQDQINGGPGSTEKMFCERDPTRQWYADRTLSTCGCRCCTLAPSAPRTKCISAAGYIGIDPSNPDANWFGVKVRNLVLQNIFDAFVDGSPQLPSVLGETGFPGITTASFSALSEQEPVPGVKFPKGIYFKGAFNILGYKGRAEIEINPTNGFLVDIALAPLKIGGDIFVFVKNRTALNEGPFLYVDARGSKMIMPTIQGSGLISLFGDVVSASAIVDIVMPNRFRVYLDATFFSLEARVNVTADLSVKGWSSMAVSAYVQLRGLDTFASKVLAQISAWCQDGVKAMTAAQSAVSDARDSVEQTLLGVCRHDQCVTAIKERTDCSSWKQTLRCPEIRRGCSFFDFECHGHNFLALNCGLAEQIIEWICQAWTLIREVIVDALCDIGCGAAKFANSVAQAALGAAEVVLEAAKTVATIASKALDAISKALLEARNFFSISSMNSGFDLRLSGATAATGRFYCDVAGIIAGRSWSVGFEIDLGDLIGSAIRLFSQTVKGLISSIFGRKRLEEREVLLIGPDPTADPTTPALLDASPVPALPGAPPIPDPRVQEIHRILSDPAVVALLSNARIFRAAGLLGGEDVSIDAQFHPGGAHGLLNHAGEYMGDIPHRHKWGDRKANRKRSEIPTLWTEESPHGQDGPWWEEAVRVLE